MRCDLKPDQEPSKPPDGWYPWPDPKCEDGWSLVDNQCMKVFLVKKTWADARVACKALGGSLAKITNEARNTWISDQAIPLQPVWFFADDPEGIKSEVGTKWAMDLKENSDAYQKWFVNEPDQCCEVTQCPLTNWGGRYTWDDMACNSEWAFACEISPKIQTGIALRLF